MNARSGSIRRCDCQACSPRPLTPAEQAFVEEGRKVIATILLSAAGRRTIVIPSREEWVGVNLLERDDGLPARHGFPCTLGLTDQETEA